MSETQRRFERRARVAKFYGFDASRLSEAELAAYEAGIPQLFAEEARRRAERRQRLWVACVLTIIFAAISLGSLLARFIVTGIFP